MRQLRIVEQITTREATSLDKYLNDISKIDLLTPEEEVDLSKRIQKGDKEALDTLVKANLRFVVSVAKSYQHQGLSLSDLINEGNLGLIKAAKRFDETRGFKYISYAVRWIRQSILQAIVEQSRIVRLPINQIGSLNAVNHAITELRQTLEREPSNQEIAEVLELSQEEVEKTLSIAPRHVSLDAPFVAGEDHSLLDILENNEIDAAADRSVAFSGSLKLDIERSLSTLTKRQADVITLYFGIGREHPMTLEDIASFFGFKSRERVRQIKDKALNKLRNTSRSKNLRPYLGE